VVFVPRVPRVRVASLGERVVGGGVGGVVLWRGEMREGVRLCRLSASLRVFLSFE